MNLDAIKYWGSYGLNVMILAAIDVPWVVKAVLSGLAGLLTVVSLLNQMNVLVENVPKWRAFWVRQYNRVTVDKGKLKKFLKNKSGGKR